MLWCFYGQCVLIEHNFLIGRFLVNNSSVKFSKFVDSCFICLSTNSMHYFCHITVHNDIVRWGVTNRVTVRYLVMNQNDDKFALRN